MEANLPVSDDGLVPEPAGERATKPMNESSLFPGRHCGQEILAGLDFILTHDAELLKRLQDV